MRSHQIICIQGLWEFLIPEFGNIGNMSAPHTPFALEPLVTGIVTALAQSFFTWRIWRFSNKNKMFLVILLLLIIAILVIYTIDFKRTLGASLESLNSQSTRNLVLVLGSLIATTDALIAVIMCILLWSGRTGLMTSDRVIVRLMSTSVSTGASTAVFALFSIITSAIWPHDYYYILGEMPLCSMYCNAVLANLNSRHYIRDTNVMNTSMDTKAPGSSLKFGTVLDAAEPQQHGGRVITVE